LPNQNSKNKKSPEGSIGASEIQPALSRSAPVLAVMISSISANRSGVGVMIVIVRGVIV
jgi:hypothetical protein